MLVVRGSELNDFLRCRLRWKLRWMEGLKAKRPDGKLFFGNLFHKFAEVYYTTKDHNAAHEAMKKLYEESNTEAMDQVEVDELWELAVNVTNHYVDQWIVKDTNWQVIATELTFAIPVGNDLYYTGTIDLIYKEDGRLKFSDYKTTNSIEKYDKNSGMDRQISRYWWALQQLGQGFGYILGKDGAWYKIIDLWAAGHGLELKDLQPQEFIYNVVLRDFPKKPKQLKAKKPKKVKEGEPEPAPEPPKFSTDKSQKTTYQMYFETLAEAGVLVEDDQAGTYIPQEYTEIMEVLKAAETEHGNRFFRRVPVHRNQHEVNASIKELFYTSQDIIEVRQDPSERHTYRNITTDCSWDCQYYALCNADIAGEDTNLIRNLAYELEVVK